MVQDLPLAAGTPAAQEALALARDQWRTHPHFAQQALLLGSHRNFRRIGAQLISWAEEGVSERSIRHVFDGWKQAMHSHERYEEYKLYPFLEERWGLSCTAAIAGHEQLHAAEASVRAASNGDGAASAALAQALRDHHTILLAHLDLEEALVIPALLALTPEEFTAYYRA